MQKDDLQNENKFCYDVKNIETMTSKEVLNLLLLAFNEEERAQCLTKDLLDNFTNFCAILNAPYKELMKIPDMDVKTAQFLRFIPMVSRFYMNELGISSRRVYDAQSAYEMLKSKFIGRTTEAIGVIILNGKGQVKFNNIICEGVVSLVPVYIRRLMEICIEYEADTLILAHNHPNGNIMPSRGDLVATKEIQLALDVINVNFEDHLIFFDGGYTSLKKSGWLTDVSKSIQDFRKGILEKVREDEEKIIDLVEFGKMD